MNILVNNVQGLRIFVFPYKIALPDTMGRNLIDFAQCQSLKMRFYDYECIVSINIINAKTIANVVSNGNIQFQKLFDSQDCPDHLTLT